MKRFALLLTAFVACIGSVGPAEPSRAEIVWSGDVDPADPTTWTASTTGYVGKTADGSLTVDGDSDLISRYGFIGQAADVAGQATVTGTGSTWKVSSSFVVGGDGNGTLNVINGGAVSNSYFCHIGSSSGSMGRVSVDGAGSNWTNTNYLHIGRSGTGMLAIANGGSVHSTVSYLGDSSGSTGTAIVGGVGSTWINTNALWIGRYGDGALTVVDGGAVSSASGSIGSYTGSTGTVTVDGISSSWTNSGDLYVGQHGNATLNVFGGGSVLVGGTTYVGYGAESTGRIDFGANGGTLTTRSLHASLTELDGTGTINTCGLIADIDLVFDSVNSLRQTVTLNSRPGQNIALNLDVSDPDKADVIGLGYEGNGSLIVRNSTILQSRMGHLGYKSGSTGSATIRGSGSVWVNSGGLSIGYLGYGTLLVTEGGTVRNSSGSIGSSVGPASNVTVSGAGSVWTNNLHLHVNNGTLNISEGGSVWVGNTTYVGNENYDATGMVSFGPGGGALTTRTLRALPSQLTGIGTINTRGLMSDIDLVFDSLHRSRQTLRFDNESGQDITVNLDMSSLNAPGDLAVGYKDNGSLTIRQGITVSSGWGYVGYRAEARGVATVSGANSAWINKNELYIGRDGGSGTLSISDGGRVASSSGYLGHYSGAVGEATVSGTQSTWVNNYSLYIGRYHGSGTLTVSDGGRVSSASATVASDSGARGHVTVSGTGATWTNSGSLSIGDAGGRGTLRIMNGGCVTSLYGDLGVRGNNFGEYGDGEATVSGDGSLWINTGNFLVGGSGTGTLTITNNGLVTVGGTVTIDQDGDGDSFVNMATGGKLALFGDADSSLDAFLNLIKGTDAIRYWDAALDQWAPITAATPGVDYNLTHVDDAGNGLHGYTVLTVGVVPEPGTFAMLLAAAMVMLVRRP